MSGHRPVGIVLAGGVSQRMGVDKATIVVDGKPMAVRVADALWEAGCHPVECQGGDAGALTEYGLDVLPDREERRGPLAGIRDALTRHADADVVVAACDLVDLDGAAVTALIDAGTANPVADVTVACSDGGRHLVSWWRAGSAARVGVLLDAGTDSYRSALDQLRTVDVAVESRTIRNVNTPSDLQRGG